MNRYTAFFAAYNASVKAGNYATKEEIVKGFTDGATDSLRELTDSQLKELTDKLSKLNLAPATDDKADKMRKAIIAIFHKLNKTPADAKAWAEKQGVKGVKKKFNDYTTGELHVLIRIAEKWEDGKNNAVRKELLKAPF